MWVNITPFTHHCTGHKEQWQNCLFFLGSKEAQVQKERLYFPPQPQTRICHGEPWTAQANNTDSSHPSSPAALHVESSPTGTLHPASFPTGVWHVFSPADGVDAESSTPSGDESESGRLDAKSWTPTTCALRSTRTPHYHLPPTRIHGSSWRGSVHTESSTGAGLAEPCSWTIPAGFSGETVNEESSAIICLNFLRLLKWLREDVVYELSLHFWS